MMQLARRLFGRGPDTLSSESELIADVEQIERYSHHWEANASSYKDALSELRMAAKRLVSILEAPPGDPRRPSGALLGRFGEVGDHIACLARQPTFFTDIFHGVQMLPDGTFAPLVWSERVHFLEGGLLGHGDRKAVIEIYRRIRRNRRGPLRVVEIGSAVGRGSTRIGGEVVRREGGLLYCVDVWNEQDRYLAFLSNLQIFQLESTVVPIRSPSVPAAKLFDDESLDAVFIDGSHYYADVLADIDAYAPKVRKGGIIFGHDLHDVPSRFDRQELLSVSDKNNTDVNYRSRNGGIVRANVHPGVILAVQDRFGDDVEVLPDSVVWARQR
jgi:hypothetical protein